MNSNYVCRHHNTLKRRHYPLLANQAFHWFNAYPGRLADCKTMFDDDFYLVLWRDRRGDDAYVIPYTRLKSLFVDRNLVLGSGGTLRWHGEVRDGSLKLRSVEVQISVSDCHNAFEGLHATLPIQ